MSEEIDENEYSALKIIDKKLQLKNVTKIKITDCAYESYDFKKQIEEYGFELVKRDIFRGLYFFRKLKNGYSASGFEFL